MKRLTIDPNNNCKVYKLDARGARPKFWFSFNDDIESGNFEQWLFKNTNRSETTVESSKTFEDIGEVIFYKICKKLGVDCVEYKLATHQNEDKSVEGVICKNYNPDDCVELAGYSILEAYRRFIYDNFNGLDVPNDNTLENYKKSLNCIMLNHTQFEKDQGINILVNIRKLYNQMAKMMILDYICCQSDRNWYNLSFLIDSKTRELRMAPLFDNGNIFSWNFRKSVIEHQNIVLSKDPTYERYLELYQSKSIAMGIKTPVSHRDMKNPTKSNNLKFKDIPMDLLENELASVIANDKELQQFLQNCQNINSYLQEAFDEFKDEYEEDCSLLKNQSSLIASIKSEHLLELVNKKIQEMEEEDENTI